MEVIKACPVVLEDCPMKLKCLKTICVLFVNHIYSQKSLQKNYRLNHKKKLILQPTINP